MCIFKVIGQVSEIMLKLLDIRKSLHFDSLGLPNYGTIENFKKF